MKPSGAKPRIYYIVDSLYFSLTDMLKKFATIAVTITTLLAMTTPAFAAGNKKNDQRNKPTKTEIQPQQTKKQKRDAALAARKTAEATYIAAIKTINQRYASSIAGVKNLKGKEKISALKAARINRDAANKLAKDEYKSALTAITLQK